LGPALLPPFQKLGAAETRSSPSRGRASWWIRRSPFGRTPPGTSLWPPVPAHEHAVVMQAVLIQQAGLDEAPDHLGGDASLLKIGKHPPLVLVGDGQGKGRLFLLRGWSRARGGGVPGAVSVELQQVGHGIPESLPAELLQEGDGVPACAVGVALPGSAVFDDQAVHLSGGVVAAAQSPDAVA